MNVEAHNIMPTVDCSGFHNSAVEYQRELAGICHNSRPEYTLSYSLSTVAVKYKTWVCSLHSLPAQCYLLPFFLNNSVCSDKPRNQGFKPYSQKAHYVTGISITQTKDKWNVKTDLPTQHV